MSGVYRIDAGEDLLYRAMHGLPARPMPNPSGIASYQLDYSYDPTDLQDMLAKRQQCFKDIREYRSYLRLPSRTEEEQMSAKRYAALVRELSKLISWMTRDIKLIYMQRKPRSEERPYRITYDYNGQKVRVPIPGWDRESRKRDPIGFLVSKPTGSWRYV